MGHFAWVCRSKQNNNDQRRINYVEDASSNEKKSEPEEIRQKTQINKILPTTMTTTVLNTNKQRRTEIHF